MPPTVFARSPHYAAPYAHLDDYLAIAVDALANRDVSYLAVPAAVDQACRDRGDGFSGRHDRLERWDDGKGDWSIRSSNCLVFVAVLLLPVACLGGSASALPICFGNRVLYSKTVRTSCELLLCVQCHCLLCCQRTRRHLGKKRQQVFVVKLSRSWRLCSILTRAVGEAFPTWPVMARLKRLEVRSGNQAARCIHEYELTFPTVFVAARPAFLRTAHRATAC